jgi:hypothetical protein
VSAGLIAADSDVEPGFTRIFNGKNLEGWKMATENTNAFTIQDGAIVAKGQRCHLFYVGDGQPFTDFELKVDVMTGPNSNGGIYVCTRYQETDWPRGGFETQVNNTHGDWKKTGSIYDVANVNTSLAKDNEWWTQHVIVKGNKITVKVNDKIAVEYTEPPGAQPQKPFERKIGPGTIALQAHDPGSLVKFKNIRVKKL